VTFVNLLFSSTIFFLFHSFFYHILLQFVVGLGDKVSPTDIEEGMRVG
jgi:hypothetical protein